MKPNPKKAFKTGEKLIKQMDLDLASTYFESAGENFMMQKDAKNAEKAFLKLIYCYDTMDEIDLAENARTKLKKIHVGLGEEK